MKNPLHLAVTEGRRARSSARDRRSEARIERRRRIASLLRRLAPPTARERAPLAPSAAAKTPPAPPAPKSVGERRSLGRSWAWRSAGCARVGGYLTSSIGWH
jgi:hypothetical protein